MLYPILKEAKKCKLKATLKYDKIIIDDKSYSTDMLGSLPANLKPDNLATRTRNNITCFFTGASPLVDFHIIRDGFQIEGKTYDCVERYYQIKCARFAERPDVILKMQKARGPLQCKILGDSLKMDEDKWLPVAQNAMHTACSAKFLQHEPSQNFLINTGDSKLAEASSNQVLGIGLKLESPDAFIRDKWQGQNNLGNILGSIREEIKLMT